MRKKIDVYAYYALVGMRNLCGTHTTGECYKVYPPPGTLSNPSLDFRGVHFGELEVDHALCIIMRA